MATCSVCKADVPISSNFCANCGSRIGPECLDATTAGVKWLQSPPAWLKVLVGVGTLWPMIYAAIFAFLVLREMLSTVEASGAPDRLLWVLVPMHVATMIAVVAVLAFCIAVLMWSGRVRESDRILWLLLLLFLGALSMPVFFFLYVWPARRWEPTVR